jgi:hypothetical protein
VQTFSDTLGLYINSPSSDLNVKSLSLIFGDDNLDIPCENVAIHTTYLFTNFGEVVGWITTDIKLLRPQNKPLNRTTYRSLQQDLPTEAQIP